MTKKYSLQDSQSINIAKISHEEFVLRMENNQDPSFELEEYEDSTSTHHLLPTIQGKLLRHIDNITNYTVCLFSDHTCNKYDKKL